MTSPALRRASWSIDSGRRAGFVFHPAQVATANTALSSVEAGEGVAQQGAAR